MNTDEQYALATSPLAILARLAWMSDHELAQEALNARTPGSDPWLRIVAGPGVIDTALRHGARTMTGDRVYTGEHRLRIGSYLRGALFGKIVSRLPADAAEAVDAARVGPAYIDNALA